MTQMRDTERLLRERILDLQEQLEAVRDELVNVEDQLRMFATGVDLIKLRHRVHEFLKTSAAYPASEPKGDWRNLIDTHG